MSGSDAVDQPLTGFGYDYWFDCTGCPARVCIVADLYERQCTSQAEFTVCTSCGTAVDITKQSPTLRDTEDPALQSDSVERFAWYHSSRYENWPDLEAYTADVTAVARQTAERDSMFFDADRYIATKLSLAVHLGTYEATIENILRRLEDQDHSNIFATRYWLHRVEIALTEPNDLYSEVMGEFPTMLGDVELEQLDVLGARAARYINRHEAIGSVSLAIAPALVAAVSTLELPLAEAALPETATAAEATASMVRPVQSDNDAYDAWVDFAGILQSEYLSGVNPQVREPFLHAIGKHEAPVEYHRRFRVLSGLLMRPEIVIDRLASAPRRKLFSE